MKKQLGKAWKYLLVAIIMLPLSAYSEMDTVYIAYDGAHNGEGTIENPYDDFSDLQLRDSLVILLKGGNDDRYRLDIITGYNNVVISSYGNSPAVVSPFSYYSSTNVTIKDIHISGGGQYSKGIKAGQLINFTVDNVEIYGAGIETENIYFGIWAKDLTNFVLKNSRLYHLRLDALYLSSIFGFEMYNNEIYNVNMSNGAGDGIQFQSELYDIHIHHNIIDRSSSQGKFCIIASGINESDRVLIEYNHLIGPAGGKGGAAIFWAAPSRLPAYFRGNIIEGSPTGIYSHSLAYVHHNIFKNNSIGIHVEGNTLNVANNVFYGNGEALEHDGEGYIINNIFYLTDRSQSSLVGSWQNDTLNIQNIMGANDVNDKMIMIDPMFVDPLNGDFHLQAGSPAIDAGIDLNLDFDQEENVNFCNGTPDIGALEFQNNCAEVQNHRPVLVPPRDTTLFSGTKYYLDLRNSYDLDDTIFQYWWHIPEAMDIFNYSEDSSLIAIFTPTVERDTTFIITTYINDYRLFSDTAQIRIRVMPANVTPIADAGEDMTVNEGVLVQLDGTGTYDANGDNLVYLWSTDSPDISLRNSNSSTPSFYAPLVDEDTEFHFSLIVFDGIDISAPDTLTITVQSIDNSRPIAILPDDYTVFEGTRVVLDGSASYDPDNQGLRYYWVGEDGILIFNNGTANPHFYAPQVDSDSVLTFLLEVNDGELGSELAEINITVINNLNEAPVAEAESPLTVTEASRVVLNAIASYDPESHPLSFIWTAPAGISLFNAGTANPYFYAPSVAEDSVIYFHLTVHDGELESESITVEVNITKITYENTRPVAVPGNDISAVPGDKIVFDGSASYDPDGDNLHFLWDAEGINLIADNTDSAYFYVPNFPQDTVLVISLRVDDGELESELAYINVSVDVPQNERPVASFTMTPSTADYNERISLNATASFDADGDNLSYIWDVSNGISLINPLSATPYFYAPVYENETQIQVTLIVVDNQSESYPISQILTVNAHTLIVPTADAGANQEVVESQRVNLNGANSRANNGNPLTYYWSVPDNIVLYNSSSSTPYFYAPEVSEDTVITVSLVVNNGELESEMDEISITIRNNTNNRPVAVLPDDFTAYEGEKVFIDASGSYDEDDNTLSYIWSSPVQVFFNTDNPSLPYFFAPNVESDTVLIFELFVADSIAVSLPESVAITIIPKGANNNTPIANAGVDFNATIGERVELDGTLSSDPDGDVVNYTWSAPSGIVLVAPNTATPYFYAPSVTEDTEFTFSLIVNDGQVESSIDEVTVTIVAMQSSNTAPIANAGDDVTANVGQRITLNGAASSDPDGDNLNYNWYADQGIILINANSATPSFYAPIVDEETVFTVTLVVNDGVVESAPDEVLVTVTFEANTPPVANAGADFTVSANSTVVLNATASSDADGHALGYIWTAPDGIVLLNSTTATPQFIAPEFENETELEFTLLVNDGLALSNEDVVIVTVLPASSSTPVASAGNNRPVFAGEKVTLDGTQSYDPDDKPLVYYWEAPEGITLVDANRPTPVFWAPTVDKNTDFIFILTVHDGVNVSVEDTVVITVKPSITDVETLEKSVNVYPTYPTEKITVDANVMTDITVDIYSSIGTLVSSTIMNPGQSIDVSTLASDIYYVLVKEDGNIIHTTSIIK